MIIARIPKHSLHKRLRLCYPLMKPHDNSLFIVWIFYKTGARSRLIPPFTLDIHTIRSEFYLKHNNPALIDYLQTILGVILVENLRGIDIPFVSVDISNKIPILP